MAYECMQALPQCHSQGSARQQGAGDALQDCGGAEAGECWCLSVCQTPSGNCVSDIKRLQKNQVNRCVCERALCRGGAMRAPLRQFLIAVEGHTPHPHTTPNLCVLFAIHAVSCCVMLCSTRPSPTLCPGRGGIE